MKRSRVKERVREKENEKNNIMIQKEKGRKNEKE